MPWWITFSVQALSLAVGLSLGAALPRRDQPLFHKGTLINIGNAILLYPVRLGLTMAGVTSIKVGLVPMAWLSHPVLQFLFCFLVLDFSRYWVHYAGHRVPFLWSVHRVHHSAETMDSTVGFRMHLVDFIILTMTPVLLFGVIFDTSGFAPWVTTAALIPGILADGFQHSNMRWSLDVGWQRAWNVLLNNPLFHSWHHTRDGATIDGNYSNTLIIWDRLFGTDVSRPKPPDLYGVDGDQRLQESLVGLQLLRPRS